MTTEEYDPLAKGLGLQYVLRGRFTDLYIHGTAATGFGCDFLQDTVVEPVLAEACGRQGSGPPARGPRPTAWSSPRAGSWTNGRVVDNDLRHNAAVAPTRFDTPPTGCRWHGNDD